MIGGRECDERTVIATVGDSQNRLAGRNAERHQPRKISLNRLTAEASLVEAGKLARPCPRRPRVEM